RLLTASDGPLVIRLSSGAVFHMPGTGAVLAARVGGDLVAVVPQRERRVRNKRGGVATLPAPSVWPPSRKGRAAVETVPREVGAQVASPGAVEAPPPARIAFTPSYTPVEPVTSDRFTPVQLRLGLQRRAAANLRSHMVRAVRRFAVLVVADLASFYVMRELVRAVRELPWLVGPLDTALPRGILNGWQYAVALFVALFVTGNYGRGDQRRDPRRLFLACALATALPLWMAVWPRGIQPGRVQNAITTLLGWAGLRAERPGIGGGDGRRPTAH